jgi:DNA repair protein RecO (recombination protein O)
LSRYEKARGIILSSRPLGEADRIVSLFSRELGRLDAVVKGVRRTKSRWGGRLEPFGVVDLVLFRGRSHVRDDREAMAAAALACEAVAGLFGEEEANERVFNLLARSLTEIDRGFVGPARSSPLVLGVLMKLLHEAGYLPVLDQCAACGSGGLALAFSASRGGLVCECSSGEGVPVTPDAVEAMRGSVELPLAQLRLQGPAEGAEEALRHIHQLYTHETGTRLRALRFAQAG